ncbi:MAG TPA: hypothetical protein VEY11_04120 [Pyrinomonadaceae bacterium]|nr:hypothetical protein [Pyrinomonadaceae bacterium]
MVCVLSEMYPPWLYKDGSTSRQLSAGYHFLGSPPAPAPYEKMKEIFSIPDTDPPHYFRSHKDELRQYLQSIILAFLTLGSLLVAGARQRFVLRVLSIMSLVVACTFISLLVFYAATS